METYEDLIYNIIEDACRQVELSFDQRNNRLELDPSSKMIENTQDTSWTSWKIIGEINLLQLVRNLVYETYATIAKQDLLVGLSDRLW